MRAAWLAAIALVAGCQKRARLEPPPPAIGAAAQKLRGTWRLDLASTAAQETGDSRQTFLILDFSLRTTIPTDEEMKAAGLGLEEIAGIRIVRQKRATDPQDPVVAEVLDRFSLVPRIEFRARNYQLRAGANVDNYTYTVIAATDDALVLRAMAVDGTFDLEGLRFDGDRLRLYTVEGTLDLVRDTPLGDPDEKKGYQGPDLTASDDASAILGSWNMDTTWIELRAGGGYVIHGEGGDIPGEWRLVSRAGEVYTIRTRLADFSWEMGDTIEITRGDADHMTWRNTAGADPAEMTRRAL